MAKVLAVQYVTDDNTYVNYSPTVSEEIDDETLSALLKLVDGKDIQDVIEDYI